MITIIDPNNNNLVESANVNNNSGIAVVNTYVFKNESVKNMTDKYLTNLLTSFVSYHAREVITALKKSGLHMELEYVESIRDEIVKRSTWHIIKELIEKYEERYFKPQTIANNENSKSFTIDYSDQRGINYDKNDVCSIIITFAGTVTHVINNDEMEFLTMYTTVCKNDSEKRYQLDLI